MGEKSLLTTHAWIWALAAGLFRHFGCFWAPQMCVNCFSKLFITKHTHNTQRHRKQCCANIKNTTARDEPTPVLADEKLTYISDVPLNILKVFEIPMHRPYAFQLPFFQPFFCWFMPKLKYWLCALNFRAGKFELPIKKRDEGRKVEAKFLAKQYAT